MMILFRRSGLFFLPVRWGGWVIALLAAGYTVFSFFEIDRRSHSASDTLINTAFRALLSAVVYSVMGFVFSRAESGSKHP